MTRTPLPPTFVDAWDVLRAIVPAPRKPSPIRPRPRWFAAAVFGLTLGMLVAPWLVAFLECL